MDNINTNELDLSVLDTLTPAEKQLALSILKEYSEEGKSQKYVDLLLDDYAETPVDIETFLHDPEYLGKGLTTDEGRFTVFPYWVNMLKKLFPNNLDTAYNTLILSGAIGLGKALSLDSNIFTQEGYKKMGELTLKDKVYGADGKLHDIIGIFPQGKKKLYKVTFTDNTNVECCEEHLWTIRIKNQEKYTRTMALKDFLDKPLYKLNSGKYKERLYYIPMTKPLDFPEKELILDPYLLGVLIGDGSLSTGEVSFTSADPEIAERIAKNIDENYKVDKKQNTLYKYSIIKRKRTAYRENNVTKQYPNKYAQEIKNLGLNTTSLHKFIPKEYLFSSIDQRVALLQGLMDTDGTIAKNGSTVQFNTCSSQLKNDFIFLVESLGGSAWQHATQGQYKDTEGKVIKCNTSYTITVKLPKNIIPFYVERKKSRINPKAIGPSRAIESIECVGEKECQCIYINSEDHLYLTNDLIVTHNTLVAVVAMLYMLYRMLCLKDPYKHYGLQPIDHITFSLMNITLDAAKGVAWSKIQELLQLSPWFMRHGTVNKSLNPTWQPNSNIELIFGSQPRHVIGRAVFCLSGDTEIITPDGIIKLEEAANNSTTVYSVDNQQQIAISETCKVIPTIKTDVEHEIELEDDTIIHCTSNHRFMLQDGAYEEAQNLTLEDELFTLGNKKIKIKAIRVNKLSEPKQFYDVVDAAPYHNFIIKTNSSTIISHNCSFEDEISFQLNSDIEKQKKKAKELISSIDARMSSRFMKGDKLPTLHILASSKRTDQSFLETYIDMKKKNESKTTLIIDEPQWVVRTDKDSDKKFAVAVGNKFLESEVLPLTATEEDYQIYQDRGYSILMVPIGYYEQFLDDINIALTDVAGISTSSSLNYISGVRWVKCRNDSIKNPFTQEILEVGNGPDDLTQYYEYFDLTQIDPKMKSRPMFIHLDMSISGDKTGIAGVWIKGKKPHEEGIPDSKELFYKLAFSVAIKAPKGRQISFEKNRQFIYWLREQGFNIKGISYDTFNSVDLGQSLQARGFNCKIISVDRVQDRICVPYLTFKNAIYEERLEVYPTKLLTAEVIGLVRDSNGKIDHTPAGINSKDTSDAVCGAIYNASLHAEEFSYDFGETAENLLRINAEENVLDAKSLAAGMEEELKNLNGILTRQTKMPQIPFSSLQTSNSNTYNYYNEIIIL